MSVEGTVFFEFCEQIVTVLLQFYQTIVVLHDTSEYICHITLLDS